MKAIIAICLLSVLCCSVRAENLMNDLLKKGLLKKEQRLETRAEGNGQFECYLKADGSDYRGAVRRTESDLPCQMWTDTLEHQHDFSPENYPNSGLGTHDFCRNPDGSERPWCYTKAWYQRWEYCDVGEPQTGCGECYTKMDASDYVGKVSTTQNGKTCQKWSSQSPNSHPNSDTGDHNYCRNPDGSDRSWCYIADGSERWNYCYIGHVVPECPKLLDDRELLAACQDQIGVGCQQDAYHCLGNYGHQRLPCPKTCGFC